MKADLNLLPKKQTSTSIKLLVFILLISVIFIGFMGYFFVYIPNIVKKEISIQVDEKQVELDKYIGLEEELEILNDDIEDLKEILYAVDGITSNFVKISEKLVNIEDALPVDIILDNVTYSGWYMDIYGEAPDYENISQFMVNLRNSEDVGQVSLYTVNYEEVMEYGEVVDIKYNFYLGINYITDSADDLPDDESEEGEGE